MSPVALFFLLIIFGIIGLFTIFKGGKRFSLLGVVIFGISFWGIIILLLYFALFPK